MSNGLQKTIIDIEAQIKNAINTADWYHRQFKEWEEKIISLKHTLAELKEVEKKL